MELVSLFDHVSATGESAWRPQDPPSLDGVDAIVLDTETTGLDFHKGDKPVGIVVKRPGERSRYLPFGHAGGNLDEAVVKRWAQRELRGKKITGLAIKTEIHSMKAWGVDLEEQGNTVSDVQHSAALLDDSRKAFTMRALAADFLSGDLQKTGDDLDKTRMKDYHASIVGPYGEQDGEVTEALRACFEPMLAADDLGRVKALEDAVIFPVCHMESNAAPLDMEKLTRWNVESADEMQALLDNISRTTGFAFMPTKAEDWARLFRHCGVETTKMTASGSQLSFTDDILEQQSHPLIVSGRRAGKIGSLRSKFLVPYLREAYNGHLYYHLHQLRWEDWKSGGGTVTGRFSSSDFNIQQVPKKSKQITAGETKYFIRELFVAPPGRLWLSADAAQIEFRLAAHFFKNKAILEAYKKNPWVSFHKVVWEMVSAIKSISYDQVKNLSFALLYGAGVRKVSWMLNVSETIAREFVETYFRAFPEARTMIKRAAHVAETRGYVRTLTGRRSRFPDKQRTYKGFNSVCQGGAADINKQKIVDLHAERKYTGYLMRGTVHDETFGQVPDLESKERVMEVLNRQSFDLTVPILWEGKASENWAAA